MYFFWCAWYFFGLGFISFECRMVYLTKKYTVMNYSRFITIAIVGALFGPLLVGCVYYPDQGEVRFFGRKIL